MEVRFVLRKCLNGYTRIVRYFLQLGKRVYIKFFSPNIQVNRKTYIGRNVKLYASKNAYIDIRDVYIKDHAYIYADFGARIVVGKDSQIGMYNVIVAQKEISIGANTQTAEFVTIRDQDHDLLDITKHKSDSISIGESVWIANKVTITKGVSIGNGAVIGANSVVVKDIASYCLAVGAPAKSIKNIR